MYMTQFHLNARRAGARKLLGSPQVMHAALMSGFPPGVGAGRVLWRIDHDADPLRPAVFVVSSEPIDVAHIEEQGGWPSQPTTRQVGYDSFLRDLAVGQVWAFRLRANPTHRANVLGKKRVLAHVTASQQLQWLLARAPEMGCEFGTAEAPTVAVTNREVVRFRRDGASVTLGVARFDGALTVTDPERLRVALTQGVGRAKAYGCGLLTLAQP